MYNAVDAPSAQDPSMNFQILVADIGRIHRAAQVRAAQAIPRMLLTPA